MQFATSDQIFLLDMITLHSLLHKSDWFLLANALFCNEEMIKLGQQMNWPILFLKIKHCRFMCITFQHLIYERP